MAKFIIFGAGKIARGFIGHLLYLAGHTFVFVDTSSTLVKELNTRGQYLVRVFGAPEKDTTVKGVTALQLDDIEGISREIAGCSAVFTAVGGKNLPALAAVLAVVLPFAGKPINIITCENWKEPALRLKALVEEIKPGLKNGYAESVVMRSAIEPDPETLKIDPLAVNVQNYWHLPVDADALIPGLPAVEGIEPVKGFSGFLERKFYTYNAANGAVSYMGALLGYKIISEAARDERIIALLDQVYQETGKALSIRHGIPLKDQMDFAKTSLNKLQDPIIVDYIERNARDPLRKLGPEDRLTGSARLAQQYKIIPHGLATAIAAAIHYHSPGDSSAEELETTLNKHGSGYILQNICKIKENDELYTLILQKEEQLTSSGYIKLLPGGVS
jgi:mannitol-1-phosphate 5-dehydrogenase